METVKFSPVEQYISQILQSNVLGREVCCHKVLPATAAKYDENKIPWNKALANLLSEKNIKLYSHQALATDLVRSGRPVVIATPTASGKSLIYNLPVLEKYLRDPNARALYIFPLKALAQNQYENFMSLCSSWPRASRPTAALYDGDTNESMRRKIRTRPPTILITNPEMLHLAMLPWHQKWTEFFASLSLVVVDEAHVYRGVFGSHMAQVFRRLNRISARYGSFPTYIACTATVGNPSELAGSLLGISSCGDNCESPVVVSESGAPGGKRHYLFINPEQAASTTAIELLKRAVTLGLRTIVYCKSRRMTELISIWANSEGTEFHGRLSAYRAGYLPEERRKIEASLASGELLAVVSTSALELGIDIGGLDVCILVGYPGTVVQTMQRGGRVGRSNREAAVIMVAGEDALDQYFARNPEDFFRRKPEPAVLNPHNEVILARHLECAAAEAPLRLDEAWLKNPVTRHVLHRLVGEGVLTPDRNGAVFLATRKNPHHKVNLRGTGRNLSIETDSGIIGSIDEGRAMHEAHDGAVYLHHGKSYLIEKLDLGTARIFAREARVQWYTRTRGHKTTDILTEKERIPLGRCLLSRGSLRITEEITGYEKRASSGSRLLTIQPLNFPPLIFETEGLWYVIPDRIRIELEGRFIHFMAAIHALEHALIGLMPLRVMSDRNDFGGISIPLHPQLGKAAIFVYDAFAGGAGLTKCAFSDGLELLRAVRKTLSGCECDDGCPSCVHSPKCGSGNRPLSKTACLALLDELLRPGNEGEELMHIQISSRATDLLPAATECTCTDLHDRIPEYDRMTDIQRTEKSPAGGLHSELQESYLVFDVETRKSAAEVGGWGRAHKMGVSIAVAYDSREDRFFSYQQEELAALFDRMKNSSLIIGFNNRKFDFAVLSPFAMHFGGIDWLRNLPGIDLLQRVHEQLGYRVSLENLGQATLNSGKSANGLQALTWWKEGRIKDIEDYCRRDVRLTRDIYLFGRREGHVFFRNKAGQKVAVHVDFSYASR